MNVLFMSLLDYRSIEEHNIYTDLLREFQKNGHNIYAISPIEKRKGKKEEVLVNGTCTILKPVIGNTQKTNYIEKGISTITLENILLKSIKKNFDGIEFNLLLYTTPPITFQKIIKYLKQKNHAISYLLLKDIFPQNAVDLGLLSRRGIKGLIYNFFRIKEKKLYANSDYIGCMSEANVEYVLQNNREVETEKVEVCPNSIEIEDIEVPSVEEKQKIREKYHIPVNKVVFVYGGNLGKPQGIDFFIQCLKENREQHAFFLIIGDGTEFNNINKAINDNNFSNVLLLKALPKKEYEALLRACDVGLIFLDNRFSIPNFPSRILSYMGNKMPVLAATDCSTDIGKKIEEGNFGFWCSSTETQKFMDKVHTLCLENELRLNMAENSYRYLINHYGVSVSYKVIMAHFKWRNREEQR